MKKENKKNYQNIGKKLAGWRVSQNLSGYRVEQLTGVRRDTLSRIENGEGVNGEALLAYLVLAYKNGFKVIEKILNDISDEETMKTFNRLLKPLETEKIPTQEGTFEKEAAKEENDECDDDYQFAVYLYEEALGRLDGVENNNASGLLPEYQVAILKRGRCPMCGRAVEIKKSRSNKDYIGHIRYSKDCDYYAYGTIKQPRISESFNKPIFPIADAIELP